jgi:hypothetical protein
MLFLVNNEKQIIFGWSAKCGCTHIKNLFYFFETDKIINELHSDKDYNFDLPENIQDYIVILFIRNPYKRLVSGFLDKYNPTVDKYYKGWKNQEPLTFRNFVNELYYNSFKLIDKHHFTPQLSESYTPIINKAKNIIIYDIEKINYEYLAVLFNKKIPDEVINFRGDHNNKYTNIIDGPVYDLHIKSICDKKPILSNFFDDDIKRKVDQIYKVDFDYFRSKKIDFEFSK